jgi:hypothetical protein
MDGETHRLTKRQPDIGSEIYRQTEIETDRHTLTLRQTDIGSKRDRMTIRKSVVSLSISGIFCVGENERYTNRLTDITYKHRKIDRERKRDRSDRYTNRWTDITYKQRKTDRERK